MMDFRDEILFLAYTIGQEAGWEPYEGKLGVAYVIMNRAENAKVSVSDTVFKSLQFSCWNADSPTRMNIDVIPIDVLRESYKGACAAYFHLEEDLTHGSTHYLNEEMTRKLRGGSLPGWFDESKVTVRIGRHTFLKLG